METLNTKTSSVGLNTETPQQTVDELVNQIISEYEYITDLENRVYEYTENIEELQEEMCEDEELTSQNLNLICELEDLIRVSDSYSQQLVMNLNNLNEKLVKLISLKTVKSVISPNGSFLFNERTGKWELYLSSGETYSYEPH